MRLLRAVVPLIMLMAASPAVMAESECKYDWCDLDGECLSTCVAVYDNIFLEDASQATITTNTATSHTNTNTNSVSDRIASLLERLERVEIATRQHTAHSASSVSHQPITGIVDTDEYNPDPDGDFMPFRRAQVGLRPPTDDALMEQHISMPALMERMARIEKAQQQQHYDEEEEEREEDEPQTGIIGTTNQDGGVAKQDGSWFTYATGAADEPSDDQDYLNLLEQRARAAHARHVASEPSLDYIALLEQRARAAHARHTASASEPQTGIIGTDDEIPGEDGPGQQFFRGQFGPHSTYDDDDDEEHVTAMMERIQRLEHTMSMAEQQQQQQQHSSLLEASATTRHHSRLRRLRAAIDATRT